MALIFLGVLIVIAVSSFNKSEFLDFITNDEWPQFTQPQYSKLSGLGAILEYDKSCNRSQYQFPSFKIPLWLIWSALPEKAIDNSVKDYHKRL